MSASTYEHESEYDLQVALVEYLVLQHPDVLFCSDLGGLRLPIGLAVKAKHLRQGRGWPDLFIAEPRGRYAGLFLELKLDLMKIYTLKSELRQGSHIWEQQAMLLALRERGFKAVFGCGFGESRAIIDDYLGLKVHRGIIDMGVGNDIGS